MFKSYRTGLRPVPTAETMSYVKIPLEKGGIFYDICIIILTYYALWSIMGDIITMKGANNMEILKGFNGLDLLGVIGFIWLCSLVVKYARERWGK